MSVCACVGMCEHVEGGVPVCICVCMCAYGDMCVLKGDKGSVCLCTHEAPSGVAPSQELPTLFSESDSLISLKHPQ